MLAILAGLQLGNIRLDASSDSLLLQGDPDLLFRETIGHYTSDEASGEFHPDLAASHRVVGPRSLDPLARMVEQLEEMSVSSVTSILDVPLLESPPLSLADLAEAESLPTLRDEGVDSRSSPPAP